MAFNNSKNKEFLNLPEQVEYLSKVVADYPNTEELKSEIDSKLNNSGNNTYNGTLQVRDDFVAGGIATAKAITLTNSDHQILAGGNYFSFPTNGGTLLTNASEENVEFGKDIEVGGNIKVNAPEDIVFKEDNKTLKDKLNSISGGSSTTTHLYRHTITLIDNDKSVIISFTAYLSFNNRIDSFDALCSYLNGAHLSCSGAVVTSEVNDLAIVIDIGSERYQTFIRTVANNQIILPETFNGIEDQVIMVL